MMTTVVIKRQRSTYSRQKRPDSPTLGGRHAAASPCRHVASVDVFDTEGMTQLTLAVENEFLGPAELLLDYGAC